MVICPPKLYLALERMTILLSIEAASDSCSVALQIGDTTLQRIEAAPRMHSRLLYPMLNSLMAEAGVTPKQLDGIAFVQGPGSFTGLRIAAATAQGIGYACDTPLIGVSTLQAMAQQAYIDHQATRVLPLMDARMNEVYLGYYELDTEKGIMCPAINDQIQKVGCDIASAEKITHLNGVYGCGHGFKIDPPLLQPIRSLCGTLEPDQILEAKSLLPMANALFLQKDTLLPEEVELVYLREQSHWKTIKEQATLKKER